MARVRTQVYLEERQYERLREEAFRQRLSLSELIRRLIEQALFGGQSEAGLERSRLREKALGFVGKGHDPKGDVARNHDRYLASLG